MDLELAPGAWWAPQWVYNWRQWQSLFQSPAVANHPAGRGSQALPQPWLTVNRSNPLNAPFRQPISEVGSLAWLCQALIQHGTSQPFPLSSSVSSLCTLFQNNPWALWVTMTQLVKCMKTWLWVTITHAKVKNGGLCLELWCWGGWDRRIGEG